MKFLNAIKKKKDKEHIYRQVTPEELDFYLIGATGPVVVSLVILTAVALAVLIWGFTGKLAQHMTVQGIVDEEKDYSLTLYVDAEETHGMKVIGMEAQYTLADGTQGTGKVVRRSTTPLSAGEIEEIYQNEYLASHLASGEYCYCLEVMPDEDLSEHSMELCDISLITDYITPVSYLLA